VSDQDQLIAVAEVLGVDEWLLEKGGLYYQANYSGYTAEVCAAGRYSEAHAKHHAKGCSGEVKAVKAPFRNWLTSLDACFADIIPAMDKQNFDFELNHWSDDPEWECAFFNGGKGYDERARAAASTAPRAIVKAFLIYNNRWIE